AANLIHQTHGDECKNQVHRAGDDNIEKNIRNFEAGGGKDLLGIVEDDVDATPLLENREDNPDEERLSNAGLEQLSELRFFCLIHYGRPDLSERLIAISAAADLSEDAPRLVSCTLGREPARAFRDHERPNEEQSRWYRGHAKHPAPPHLPVPRIQNVRRTGGRRNGPR